MPGIMPDPADPAEYVHMGYREREREMMIKMDADVCETRYVNAKCSRIGKWQTSVKEKEISKRYLSYTFVAGQRSISKIQRHKDLENGNQIRVGANISPPSTNKPRTPSIAGKQHTPLEK